MVRIEQIKIHLLTGFIIAKANIRKEYRLSGFDKIKKKSFQPVCLTELLKSPLPANRHLSISTPTSVQLLNKLNRYACKTCYFRKLNISFSKNRQNVPGTILFREPNNIVCRVKHISFMPQTLLFRAQKSNVWNIEMKNREFHSLEGVRSQQIGRYHKASCLRHKVSQIEICRVVFLQDESIRA